MVRRGRRTALRVETDMKDRVISRTDSEAARVEALAAAREVLGDAIKAGQGQDNRQYEITDEAGQVLATIPLMDALKP
jgi:phage host-nuclease inhibitor protein Gam